jgi:signal transduction histidine kinase
MSATSPRLERTEISAFAHAVSHDLRAPLANILSAVDFVAETVPRGSPADQDLALVKRNAARALEFLRRLVEYADTTNALPPAENVSLEDAVDDALAALDALVRERRAAVRVRRPLPRVVAPRKAVATIVRVLLENAILYHEPGRAPEVEIGALPAPDRGIFVRDRGVGIPEEDCERVFEPFVRLKAIPSVDGAGVGLATARRLARAIGVRVNIAPVSSGGACVDLHLPLA